MFAFAKATGHLSGHDDIGPLQRCHARPFSVSFVLFGQTWPKNRDFLNRRFKITPSQL
jgi:hypothetical protein